MDGFGRSNPQPQVVVFTRRQLRIEAADPVEQCAAQHHGRGADQAAHQAAGENIAARLAVLGVRIDPDATAQPDFLGLTDRRLGMSLKEGQLARQLGRLPYVVRIQEGQVGAAAEGDAGVARGRHAPVGLMDIAQTRTHRRKFIHQRPGPVIRAVIDYNQLKVPAGLGCDRGDGFPHPVPPVMGGNDDRHAGHGGTSQRPMDADFFLARRPAASPVSANASRAAHSSSLPVPSWAENSSGG